MGISNSFDSSDWTCRLFVFVRDCLFSHCPVFQTTRKQNGCDYRLTRRVFESLRAIYVSDVCVMSHDLQLVSEWILAIREQSDGKKPDADVEYFVHLAYRLGYQKLSDGCTVVSDLGWPIKYPPCVMHDYLYYWGGMGKRRSDALFRIAMVDFGMTRARAWLRWIGVSLGAWSAWRKHQKRRATEKGYGSDAWIEHRLEGVKP